MKAPAKRGRSYSTANTTYLLDLIEEIEPCGAEEWNSVASRYNAHFGGESRSGDDLKNKFKTLKGVKKPTGDPSCPPEVIRAKRLQKSLERRMDVQTLEDDDDNLDDRVDDDQHNEDNDNEEIGDNEEINDNNGFGDAVDDFDENFEDSNERDRRISGSLDADSDPFSRNNATSGNNATSSINSNAGSSRPPFLVSRNVNFNASNHMARAAGTSFRSVQSNAKTASSVTSQAANGSKRPPLPKKRTNAAEQVQSTTTLRTGLTEDQLKTMTSTIRERSPSPSYSETVVKRRRIDHMIEKGSEFLAAPDTSGDNMLKIMMMQSNEREAKADEWRREEREREDRNNLRREKEEHERLLREERKEEARLEREERREERREREERDRDERREKADRERSDQMMLFLKR